MSRKRTPAESCSAIERLWHLAVPDKGSKRAAELCVPGMWRVCNAVSSGKFESQFAPVVSSGSGCCFSANCPNANPTKPIIAIRVMKDELRDILKSQQLGSGIACSLYELEWLQGNLGTRVFKCKPFRNRKRLFPSIPKILEV